MGFMQRMFQRFFADPELEGLTEDQIRAVIDLLHAIVWADHTVTDEEQRELRAQVLRMPWSRKLDRPRLEEQLKSSLERASTRKEAGLAALVRQAATTLPEGGVREKIAIMMIAISCADGIADSERQLIDAFAAVAGIPQKRVVQLIEEAKKDAGA